MKVIFNTSNFPKWRGEPTTPFIFHLAQGVKSQGANVLVLAPHSFRSQKKERWKGIKIRRYQYIWPVQLQTLFKSGGAVANLKANKAKYLILPCFFFSQLFSLFTTCLKRNPDLIHSHWILPQGLTGLIVSRLLGIPHIITLHGSDVFLFNNFFFKNLKKLISQQSNFLIFNSLHLKEEFESIVDYKVKNSAVIPTPVKLNQFTKLVPNKNIDKLAKKYDLGTDKRYLLFVGRLVKEKGLSLLLRSFKKFVDARQKKDVCLIIVGEGQDEQQFKKLAKKLLISDSLHFTGWVPHSQLNKFYQLAQLFVSLSWKEGMGLTYLEALASGCYVLTSQKAGFLSLLERMPKTLKIVKIPCSPKTVSKRLKNILSRDFDRLKNIDQSASVLKPFSLSKVGKQYFSTYQEVIRK